MKRVLFLLINISFFYNYGQISFNDCTVINNDKEEIKCRIVSGDESNFSEGFNVSFNNKELKISPNDYLKVYIDDLIYESFKINNLEKKLFLEVVGNEGIRLLKHSYLQNDESNENALIEESIRFDYYIEIDGGILKIENNLDFKNQLISLISDILIKENETYFDLPSIVARYNN